MARFRDFSRDAELETVEVMLDGDTFHFAAAAPTMAVLDMAKVGGASTDMEKMAILMDFLDTVMIEDDREAFAARLRSSSNPISVDQVTDIVMWLMEEVYSLLRPTRGPSPSPNGSGTTGTSSTDGAGATDSTPEGSPLPTP